MKLLLCLLTSCLLFTTSYFAQATNRKADGPQRGTSASPSPALQVFPSPAHGEFTVRLPEAAARAGWQLELVNVLGRAVYQQALPAAAQVTVPTGTLPAGLYWVRLRGPQGYEAIQRVVLS